VRCMCVLLSSRAAASGGSFAVRCIQDPHPQHTNTHTHRPWQQEDNSPRASEHQRGPRNQRRKGWQGRTSTTTIRLLILLASPTLCPVRLYDDHGSSFRAPASAPATAPATGGQGGDASHPGIVPDQVQVSGRMREGGAAGRDVERSDETLCHLVSPVSVLQ
jgi:hypothetical protein